MRFSEVWERETQIREGFTTLWMKKRFWDNCLCIDGDPFSFKSKREIQNEIVLLASEYRFKIIEQLVLYKMKREFPSILLIEYLELKRSLMMKKIKAPPKETTSAPKFIRAKLKVPSLETETIPAARLPRLTLADFKDFEFDLDRFKVPLLETERVPTSLESTAYFSEATEEQLMTSFGKGPCFRFELYKVVPRRKPNIDPYVHNISGYDERELPLFGMIKAQNSLSDPSHDGSFYMFNADADADPDPLVYTTTGCFYMFNRDSVDPLVLTSDAISPPEICYHSIQVSTSLKLTCKLYGIAFKELIGFKNLSDYFNYREAQPKPAFRMPVFGQKCILNDVLQFSDDCHDINFSEYFAKKPRGGFTFCKLKGKDGYLEFYYAALKYAVDATLEVDFFAPSKETVVVGRVVAYYGKDFDYDCDAAREDHHYSKMFETTPDGFLLPGKINLMRSVLAVPAQFSLIIVAELRDFSSKRVILSGSYEFRVPIYDPSSVGSIKNNDGFSLRVKVGWKLPL